MRRRGYDSERGRWLLRRRRALWGRRMRGCRLRRRWRRGLLSRRRRSGSNSAHGRWRCLWGFGLGRRRVCCVGRRRAHCRRGPGCWPDHHEHGEEQHGGRARSLLHHDPLCPLAPAQHSIATGVGRRVLVPPFKALPVQCRTHGKGRAGIWLPQRSTRGVCQQPGSRVVGVRLHWRPTLLAGLPNAIPARLRSD